jgi:hypothetical protein
MGGISNLNAGIHKAADRDDTQQEKPSIGVISHVDEKPDKEETLKDRKTELNSFLKENNDNITIVQEEIEKPEYLPAGDKTVSPPGGSLLLLNPNIAHEPMPPLSEVPWWERWWNGIIGLVF